MVTESAEATSANEDGSYFCNTPWLGVLTIEVNRDVTFCPCHMKLRLGNLDDQPLEELWNGPELVKIREDFREGRLPDACQGQLCPPAVGGPDRVRR